MRAKNITKKENMTAFDLKMSKCRSPRKKKQKLQLISKGFLPVESHLRPTCSGLETLPDWFVSFPLPSRDLHRPAGGGESTEPPPEHDNENLLRTERSAGVATINQEIPTVLVSVDSQATSHGVTPLGRLKENKNYHLRALGLLVFLKQWRHHKTVTTIYNIFKYSTHAFSTTGEAKFSSD